MEGPCVSIVVYSDEGIQYAYMVQNTSDIIYSVNKYCQIEMFLK